VEEDHFCDATEAPRRDVRVMFHSYDEQVAGQLVSPAVELDVTRCDSVLVVSKSLVVAASCKIVGPEGLSGQPQQAVRSFDFVAALVVLEGLLLLGKVLD
jgi:hypothetical protein